MDQGKNFPQFENVLEIWKENIKPNVKFNCDIIIAHSLGCHFVLFDWENAKNKKVIFINPVVIKRNPIIWFWRWIKFCFHEKRLKIRKYIKNPIKIIRGIFYFFKFFTKNIFSLLNETNNQNMVVIRGRCDLYFCDNESRILLEKKGIKIVELDGVGHLWNEKIDEEIRKIIEN